MGVVLIWGNRLTAFWLNTPPDGQALQRTLSEVELGLWNSFILGSAPAQLEPVSISLATEGYRKKTKKKSMLATNAGAGRVYVDVKLPNTSVITLSSQSFRTDCSVNEYIFAWLTHDMSGYTPPNPRQPKRQLFPGLRQIKPCEDTNDAG